MLRDFWMFCSGFAAALAVFGSARQDWLVVGVGVGSCVVALYVVRRGLLGTESPRTCRHSNRMQDGTASFRRAHLALVRRED